MVGSFLIDLIYSGKAKELKYCKNLANKLSVYDIKKAHDVTTIRHLNKYKIFSFIES